MVATPHESCEILVQQVRASNLNFSLIETPFSVNISLRKRFVRDFSTGSQNSAVNMSTKLSSNFGQELVEENDKVKLKLSQTVLEKEALEKVVKELESKFESAESEVLSYCKELKKIRKDFERETEGAKVLKTVINNLNKEISKNKVESNAFAKELKTKIKEISKLDNKIDNQQDTIKNLKAEKNKLKDEKVKLEKDALKTIKKIEKKKTKQDKNHNLETNQNNCEYESDPFKKVSENKLALDNLKVTLANDVESCEACEHDVENYLQAQVKPSHETGIPCNHEFQCILRTPKPPPVRKLRNGDGLTVLLPNQAFKTEIENYEKDFGEHTCEDCNEEWIWNETNSFYRVKSCGNNLVQFEGMTWWLGEGDFVHRDQQMYTVMID